MKRSWRSGLLAAVAIAVSLVTPATAPAGAQDDELPMAGTIHAGSCDAPGAEPVGPAVNMRVRSSVPNAINLSVGSGTIDLPTATFGDTPHAVLVTFGGDPDAMVACGEIGGAVDGNDIAIGLRERNHSDTTGIAWLQQRGEGTRLTVFAGAGIAQSQFDGPDDSTDPTATADPSRPVLRVNFEEVASFDWPAASPPAAPALAFGGRTSGRLDNVAAIGDYSAELAAGPSLPGDTEAFVGIAERDGSGWSGVLWTRPEGDSTVVTAFLAEDLAQAAELEPPSFDDPPAPAGPAIEPPAIEPPAVNPRADEPPADGPPAANPPADEPPATDLPADEPPATDPPDQSAGDEGGSYASEEFGYSLAWGPEWRLVKPLTGEGSVYESFLLTNDVSLAEVGVLNTDMTPDIVLEFLYDMYGKDPATTSLMPMTDGTGEPIIAGSGNDVSETWLRASSDATVALGIRVIQLAPGEAVLILTQTVYPEDYEAEIPAIEALYAGLTLP